MGAQQAQMNSAENVVVTAAMRKELHEQMIKLAHRLPKTKYKAFLGECLQTLFEFLRFLSQ